MHIYRMKSSVIHSRLFTIETNHIEQINEQCRVHCPGVLVGGRANAFMYTLHMQSSHSYNQFHAMLQCIKLLKLRRLCRRRLTRYIHRQKPTQQKDVVLQSTTYSLHYSLCLLSVCLLFCKIYNPPIGQLSLPSLGGTLIEYQPFWLALGGAHSLVSTLVAGNTV